MGFTTMGKESGATHASDRDEGYDSVATNGLIRLVLYVMINPVGDVKRVVVVKEGKAERRQCEGDGRQAIVRSRVTAPEMRQGKRRSQSNQVLYCTCKAGRFPYSTEGAARDPHKLRRLWLCLWLGWQTTIGFDLVRYLLVVLAFSAWWYEGTRSTPCPRHKPGNHDAYSVRSIPYRR